MNTDGADQTRESQVQPDGFPQKPAFITANCALDKVAAHQTDSADQPIGLPHGGPTLDDGRPVPPQGRLVSRFSPFTEERMIVDRVLMPKGRS